jgi:hypothetical protein
MYRAIVSRGSQQWRPAMVSLSGSLRAVSNAPSEARLGDGGYGEVLERQQARGTHHSEKPGENHPDPAKMQRKGDVLEHESKGRPPLVMDNDSDLSEGDEFQHSNLEANLSWRRADPSVSE